MSASGERTVTSLPGRDRVSAPARFSLLTRTLPVALKKLPPGKRESTPGGRFPSTAQARTCSAIFFRSDEVGSGGGACESGGGSLAAGGSSVALPTSSQWSLRYR